MDFTLGTRTINLGNAIFLVGTRDCNRMKGIARAEQIIENISMNDVEGNENPTDMYFTQGGVAKFDLLGSLRSYVQKSSIPLMDREAVARSFYSFCAQMHELAKDRQLYVTNMDKDGFPCVLKCYGNPDCSYTQGQYNSVRTKAIDSAISWLDLREEFKNTAETLSEQGDNLISDQEALARLNRIQADSKQAQAEADNKALLADLMRIGIGVVAVVVVYFLWKYVAKFVR